MRPLDSAWTVAAIVIVGIAAMVGIALGTGLEAILVFLLGGVGAVLLAIYPLSNIREATPAAIHSDEYAADTTAAVLEALTDPVLLVREGRVLNANGAAIALLGKHITGEDIRTAIRHPAAAEHLARSFRGNSDRGIELVGLGTREQRWLMHVAELGDGRRLVHLVDRSLAHAAERMRVDFVANASHELRTPLAAILGFIETLGDPEAGGDEGTRNRFLNVMMKEARRMQTLVDDLISLSRIESEKHRAPDDAVDLATLVGDVNRVVKDSPDGRDRDLMIVIDKGVPPVAGDRAQLSQLLHNIVGNAIKYGRGGTPIRITMSRNGDSMVRLSVEDEGEGIASEHLPRLTERFYRVDSGRSRAMGGTGLGLSIVKHIVERHRGRLDIASIQGKGTTVTVNLPAAPGALSSN
ncbi:ATP-binding protein [Sphingomonas sp. LaA6.9]|uniref:ATP-binding protein n=1 Tax=Sphingomonas sp. LaA6.9 TaxID=2919914 RepID=UPI001F4FEEF0|nr:ATP-binding protein [Sphingomonas sp. LaA6.9]MCJ8156773.1 ATP-binding protein [Sphingomonas sp. LaA6.9]